MGYNVNYFNFNVRVTDVAAALAAINALHNPVNLVRNHAAGSVQGRVDGQDIRETLPVSQASWYAFTRNPEEGSFATLAEALDAWRFTVDFFDDPEEDPIYHYFHITGFRGENMGQEHLMLKAISHHIHPGSSFEAVGECGRRWRYFFAGGMAVQEVQVSFGPPQMDVGAFLQRVRNYEDEPQAVPE